MTPDTAHGFGEGRRYELKQAVVIHIIATTCHGAAVARRPIDHPVHDPLSGPPRQKWKHGFCGEGSHCRWVGARPRVEVQPWCREDRRHWVITRRSVSRPEEIPYCIAHCPPVRR